MGQGRNQQCWGFSMADWVDADIKEKNANGDRGATGFILTCWYLNRHLITQLCKVMKVDMGIIHRKDIVKTKKERIV